MRIRIRGPEGTNTLNLHDTATVTDLHSEIRKHTNLLSYDIKYGYPPKPLVLDAGATLLSAQSVKLNGEQLIISGDRSASAAATSLPESHILSADLPSQAFAFSGIKSDEKSAPPQNVLRAPKPIALKKQTMDRDVPEVPLPDRGATLVMRVMPDDNSCLFRAFGTAVLPGDDLTMTELRSLVASTIQSSPETYTAIVLEQEPDAYCTWIQTPDAWGGALELGILASHFDIEICSIDVQSLRIDKFNEGRPTRCVLVYSGIHYDTIVQSPSDYPHTMADSSPEFDKRVWEADDDVVLEKALELCRKLKDQHYFTDTGGMAIVCNVCKWVGYGQGQAGEHAMQTGHYDMEEVKTTGRKRT